MDFYNVVRQNATVYILNAFRDYCANIHHTIDQLPCGNRPSSLHTMHLQTSKHQSLLCRTVQFCFDKYIHFNSQKSCKFFYIIVPEAPIPTPPGLASVLFFKIKNRVLVFFFEIKNRVLVFFFENKNRVLAFFNFF